MRFGGSCDRAANSAIAESAESSVLRIADSLRRHEDIFDQTCVAVPDVLDASEELRDVERLLTHRGHHRHQQIKPFEKMPLGTDRATKHHAEMRVGVDEPREHDLAGGVDDEIAIRNGIGGTTVNGNDVVPLDHNSPICDDPVRSIHRKHEPMLDRDACHRKHQKVTAAPQDHPRLPQQLAGFVRSRRTWRQTWPASAATELSRRASLFDYSLEGNALMKARTSAAELAEARPLNTSISFSLISPPARSDKLRKAMKGTLFT